MEKGGIMKCPADEGSEKESSLRRDVMRKEDVG